MITHEFSILGPKGDIKITWDHNNPADREKARQEVAKLKSMGYLFFAVDGSPADEVTAGAGELNARIVSADEIVPEPENPQVEQPAEEPEQPKRRGRRKGVPNTVKTIAVPPLRGGSDV